MGKWAITNTRSGCLAPQAELEKLTKKTMEWKAKGGSYPGRVSVEVPPKSRGSFTVITDLDSLLCGNAQGENNGHDAHTT